MFYVLKCRSLLYSLKCSIKIYFEPGNTYQNNKCGVVEIAEVEQGGVALWRL